MEIKNKSEEIRTDQSENVPVKVQTKPKASGLGGLVPAGGKVRKSAAKQIAKII